LNYSSDIDLLIVREDRLPEDISEATLTKIIEELRAALSAYTAEGYVYRVDLRLRPYGRASHLVHPLGSLTAYYERSAALWELQAALKLRVVAGSPALGERLLGDLRELICKPRRAADIGRSIRELRSQAARPAGASGAMAKGVDVKNAPGGIRDIEFLVQGLQLANCHANRALLSQNTLDALERLHTSGLLDTKVFEELRADYLVLRRVEHVLQLMDDRQVHRVPTDADALRALALRVDPTGGSGDSGVGFTTMLARTMQRVRATFEAKLPAG
jgi:glutamate-ammonia-ligase adenylyltransferase